MDDTNIKKYKLEIQKFFLNIIGKEINKGKTKASIAKTIGISPTLISKYISGERIPKAIFVEKMIDTFNIPNEVYKEYSDIGLEHDEEYEILRQLGIKEILDILKSLNIDQKEISKRTGLTEASVSRYYRGTRNPRESYSRLL